MAELLTRLTNLFNFQKTANISAPGLLVAASVLLLLASGRPQTYEAVSSGFDSGAVQGLGLPQSCLSLSQDYHATGAISGRLSDKDWTMLQTRRAAIDDCAYQLQHIVQTDQADNARRSQEIVTAQKLHTALMKKYEDESLLRSSVAGGFRAEADEVLKSLRKAEAETKSNEARITFANGMLPRLQKDSEAISALSHSGESDELFGDLATRASNRIMYLLLLAIACGLVIDPIASLIQPLLYTDGRVLQLNATVDGMLVVPRSYRMTVYNVNYALGLGLITEADLEFLRQRYLYQSQMLLNLILPGALLLVSAGLYLDSHLEQLKTALGMI
ncbi:MAG: hypothetical protein ABI702_20230 [Burkholderiales bacterium]